MSRKTKIIASIGPYADMERTLNDLFEAGATAFRIDDRYIKLTNEKEFSDVINSIHSISKAHKTPIPIILSAKEAEIRISPLNAPFLTLKEGGSVYLTCNKKL